MQVYAAAPNWETGKHKVVIHHGERCFYGWLLKIILKIIAFNRLLFRNEKKGLLYNLKYQVIRH